MVRTYAVLGDSSRKKILNLLQVYSTENGLSKMQYSFPLTVYAEGKTSGEKEKNLYFSPLVPPSMRLLFLPDAGMGNFDFKQLENAEMIFFFLEEPYDTKKNLQNLLMQLWTKTSIPLRVILAAPKNLGLSTDETTALDSFRNEKKILDNAQIPFYICTKNNDLSWLSPTVVCSLPERRTAQIRTLIQEAKARYQNPDTKELTVFLWSDGDGIFRKIYLNSPKSDAKSVIKTLNEKLFTGTVTEKNPKFFENIWEYYRKNLLGDLCLWDEKKEKERLREALSEDFTSQRTFFLPPVEETKYRHYLGFDEYSPVTESGLYKALQKEFAKRISQVEKML